ncbi:hypothetical protein [Caulobacter sp. 1776]|uniref:hypothetical protein n=1 Tax=Caulobacter sp. 1776 TaxID=3156420 RepID=UPI003391A5AA
MGRMFLSGVLASILLAGGCATTPYSVGAAPSGASLAHYQSGRPTLISRARAGVVEITPVALEFEDRIVLAVTAINIGGAPVNFGYENVGAVYEDGGAAKLIPVQTLQREARERARIGGSAANGAVSAINYGVDATAIIDSYGRPTAPETLGVLRTTTIDPRNMVTGLVVLEKPWLNDRVRTLAVNVEFGGEGHTFRLAIARRGVLMPLGGVAAAARFDTAEGLQTLPFVPALRERQAPRKIQAARLKGSAVKTPPPASALASRSAVRFDPYARPEIRRGVIE